MQTVFDFSPTKEEFLELFLAELSKTEYESMVRERQTMDADIARLFLIRGNEAKAQTYLLRIKDPALRESIVLFDTLHA